METIGTSSVPIGKSLLVRKELLSERDGNVKAKTALFNVTSMRQEGTSL